MSNYMRAMESTCKEDEEQCKSGSVSRAHLFQPPRALQIPDSDRQSQHPASQPHIHKKLSSTLLLRNKQLLRDLRGSIASLISPGGTVNKPSRGSLHAVHFCRQATRLSQDSTGLFGNAQFLGFSRERSYPDLSQSCPLRRRAPCVLAGPSRSSQAAASQVPPGTQHGTISRLHGLEESG
jgi:hypothetical protein